MINAENSKSDYEDNKGKPEMYVVVKIEGQKFTDRYVHDNRSFKGISEQLLFVGCMIDLISERIPHT